ncbi:MAG: IPExxxVDY family protein [bacterium]|nr:IPExxxVDY family protein [bacterium]
MQLEVEEDLSFLLFGLVSSHKASQMVFCLNQIAPFDFFRVADLQMPDYNPNAATSFSKFSFFDEENHLDFHLLANKEFGLCLAPHLKQFDYLLVVRGGVEFFDGAKLAQKSRKLPGIQLLAPIENEKVKSKISWII